MSLEIPQAFYRVSAKAAIVHEGKLLLVQEDLDVWELPGGGVDHGEDAQIGLRREIREEINAEADQIGVGGLRAWFMKDPRNGAPKLALVYPTTLTSYPEAGMYNDVRIGYFTREEVATLNIDTIYDDFRGEILELFN